MALDPYQSVATWGTLTEAERAVLRTPPRLLRATAIPPTPSASLVELASETPHLLRLEEVAEKLQMEPKSVYRLLRRRGVPYGLARFNHGHGRSRQEVVIWSPDYAALAQARVRPPRAKPA